MSELATRPDLSMGAINVWRRSRDVLMRQWKTEAVGTTTEPFIVIFALGLGLGQFVELESGQDYVQFLAPGMLALFPMFSAVFECAWGSYVRLEMQGAYDAILSTPASVDDVITGEILWGATRALATAVFILAVMTLLSPWLDMVQSPLAVLVVPLSVVPGVLFSAISLCFVSIARAMSQFNYFFNLAINPMFWFGGAFFPMNELPFWAQIVGWFVPLTHIVGPYRGLVTGNLEWVHLLDLAWVLMATAFFYWLAVVAMRRRLVQ